MVKTIAFMFLAGIVFASAAAGSWWLQNRSLNTPLAFDAKSNSPAGHGSGTDVRQPGAGDTRSTASDAGIAVQEIRPEKISVEEMVRLGMNLKQREKVLVDREEQLRQDKIHQEIAFADISSEQQELDVLRTGVRSELDKAETLLTQLLQARQSVLDERAATDDKLKEMADVQLEVDELQEANTKKLAQWIQSMEEAKAAEVLREMANDGKVDVAVQILAHLEERDAAKILSELDDPKLVQDLVTAFRNLKAPKQSNGGRRSPR